MNYCISLEFSVDKWNVYQPDILNPFASPEKKKSV